MYKQSIPLAAAFAIWCGAANADAFTDQIVADLQGQGFEFIEIKDSPSFVKVEAIRGSEKLEVIYDRSTGEIVKRENEQADADEVGLSGVDVKMVADGDIGGLDDDDDDDDDDRDDDDHRDDDDDRDDDDNSGSGSDDDDDDDDDDRDEDDDDNSGSGSDDDDEDDDDDD